MDNKLEKGKFKNSYKYNSTYQLYVRIYINLLRFQFKVLKYKKSTTKMLYFTNSKYKVKLQI